MSFNEPPIDGAINDLSALQASLAQTIERRTRNQEGDCSTAIGNLLLFRRNAPSEPCACLVEPSIVLVAQGAKQLLIGDKVYAYNANHFLITSLNHPASSQILEASPEQPCLGLVLKLNLSVTTELIAQTRQQPPRERGGEESAVIGTVDSRFLQAFARLMALLDEPTSIEVLAPLIEREIHFRLLQSDIAPRLLQIVTVGSQSQRIGRAIDWLKAHYDQPLRVENLAAHVQMSTSSLHHYFRTLTAKSPLQYQKWLRLNEAKRLMINHNLEAAQAAYKVGYESPSQFSREYSRLFGASPKKDILLMRQQQNG
ncbi:AraC family transcriptional regulator [Gilvimarinus algae]|uniref:AraC family transcriptional regulator n=1 Tax=Gilvimarinus algae TaxID=3058037 RepID=A0ABT8TEA7_9GAMM|nr:AraC family transcriptional regulator [Gilvimarinus sp. SDUM040014]MDO3382430.1 AraC family transcriptional regulator [Gilvimarinus sp. SDUM040014]